jgi:ubiquinone/menaquinone biosynthesis C-methylase UbiE
MTASDAWEARAGEWTAHVRSGRDAGFAWHAPEFLELLPPPGALTVDLGCGEGRLTRELRTRGHHLVAVDVSPSLIGLAREEDPSGDYRVADAGSLPLEAGAAELVVAFMSLQDVEDAEAAIAETARVLVTGGRFVFAIVHPVATAGRLVDDETFVIAASYLEPFVQRLPLGDGEIPSFHRPLEWYFRALERAGFLAESVRELATRRRAPGRVPMFLDVRAVKP